MSKRWLRVLFVIAAGLPAAALAGSWAVVPASVGGLPGATTAPAAAIRFTGDGTSSVVNVEYDYDETRFTPVLTAQGGASCITTTAANKAIRVAAMSAGAPFPTTASTLCNVNFTIAAGVTATTYTVAASSAQCFNAQGLPQTCTTAPFDIVVGAPRTAPSVSYTPPPSTIVFPPGAPGSTGSLSIAVDGFGGTTGESVNVAQCVVLGTGLALVGNPSITIAAGDPVNDLDGAIDVSCVYAAAAQTGSVSCNETPTVGGVTNRRWTLSCPAGIAGVPLIGALSTSNVTPTSVRLNALIATNNVATTATFEYRTPANRTFLLAGATNLAASTQPSAAFFDLGMLVCNTAYEFRVSAQNANGSAGPTAPTPFMTAMCPPTGLNATLDASGLLRSGAPVTLSATATGASGMLSYHFDVDNDGAIDASSFQNSINVTYPSAFNGIAAVTVVDGTGASRRVERPVSIEAPRLLASPSGVPAQSCGDGDASPEPGERWQVPVEIVNVGTVATDDAHAIFIDHERAVAAAGGAAIDGGMRVETPAIAVGDIAPGASVFRTVVVRFAENATCGTNHRLRFFGSSDVTSHAAGSESPLVTFGLPAPAQCQVFTGCAAVAAKAAVAPRQGLYFDPDRSGNGISNFVIERPGQSPVFFGAWFTGANDRKPTWFVIQGNVVENQVVAPVLRFSQNVAAPAFSVSSVVAGSAVVDLTQSDSLTLSYEINGRFGSEQMTYFTPGPGAAPNRSGAWFSLSEGGWGQIVHQFVAGGVQQTFVVHYVYDMVGQPRWVLAQGPTEALKAATPHQTFSAHCPGCPWIAGISNAAGTGSIDLMTATAGKTSTAFVMPALFGGTWNRTNLDITLLTNPQQ